jgi:hypothetical protein
MIDGRWKNYMATYLWLNITYTRMLAHSGLYFHGSSIQTLVCKPPKLDRYKQSGLVDAVCNVVVGLRQTTNE